MSASLRRSVSFEGVSVKSREPSPESVSSDTTGAGAESSLPVVGSFDSSFSGTATRHSSPPLAQVGSEETLPLWHTDASNLSALEIPDEISTSGADETFILLSPSPEVPASQRFFPPAASSDRGKPPLSRKRSSESLDESLDSEEVRELHSVLAMELADLHRYATRTRRILHGREISVESRNHFLELLRGYEKCMEEIHRTLRHFESGGNFREFCRTARKMCR
ncbi:hypothetical protein BX616_009128, partial [Lobosporangium transversale]